MASPHPRALAEVAVGLDRGMPAHVGDDINDALDPRIYGESEGEPDTPLHTRCGERMGRARRIGAGQNTRTGPGLDRGVEQRAGVFWQRRDRQVQDGDVVRGGVRPSVPGTKQAGKCFASGEVGAVQEAQQRVESEGAFPSRGRVLLLAVRDGDRGVEVQTQPPTRRVEVGSRPGGPCPFPRHRGGCPDRGEVIGIDLVQHPPRGGHRCHRAVKVLAIPEHADPRDRVRAVSDRDREIGEHPPRRM